MAVVSNTCNGSYGDDCKIYLEYVINSQDIANNKSNITLHLYAQATSTNVGAYNFNGNSKAYIKIDGTTKKSSTTLNMDFRNKKKVEMLTWTGDVSHNTDGKLTITISANFDTNGPSSITTGSVSKSWTLTTIPRASSATCADGNIGSATTININRASSSFTHTLTYNFQGLTGTIASKTSSTSIGWTIPTSFYAKIPNAKSGQGTITCQTYSGSTLIGTKTCTFNAFVINSEPTLSATIVDSNSITVALTGNSSKLIKYFSNAKVDITAAAKNNATISSRKVVCGNKSGTSTSNTLNNIESGTFNISCSDSRGFTNNITVTKTMVEYIKLVFTELQLTRASTTSNTVNLSLNGKYFNGSFGSVTNTLSLKMRYRLKGGTWGSYTTLNPTKTNNDFTYSSTLGSTFNYKNDYEFEIVVADKLMAETKIVIVPAGEPIVDIGKDDVKINGLIYMNGYKVATFNDVYPIGSIYMSINNVNPSTLFGGTWTEWGTGRVPVGVDTSQTEFSTIEKIGGEKTHTLTIDEMPTHDHSIRYRTKVASNGTSGLWVLGAATYDGINNVPIESTGGGKGHNNLQPYVTCYMWKRIS